MFSASALAINTVVRSATAAAFPLFTPACFHNLGVGWAGTLFGSLGPSPASLVVSTPD